MLKQFKLTDPLHRALTRKGIPHSAYLLRDTPPGVVLATLPVLTRMCWEDMPACNVYMSLSTGHLHSCRRLPGPKRQDSKVSPWPKP